MGRKSVRKNKNIYQLAREQASLTRQQAQDRMVFVSAERIEKIESEKTSAKPEEILQMSLCYDRSDLMNYYCSKECPIGQKFMPYLEPQSVSQTTLSLIASLNRLKDKQSSLISIMEDGKLADAEIANFSAICADLDELCKQAQLLKLWLLQQKPDNKK